MRSFVAGSENRLAAVAVLSALDLATCRYNPLVFCGPPGVGKSHLLAGLVAEHRRRLHASQVVHTVAVDFAREYAEAVEVQSLDEFRARYREIRLLAIEDLHLIEGKITAQQELARTIDALRDNDAQVLVTLRRLPSETAGLIPALAARLDAGLIVTLAPPDETARREILDDLAAERRVRLTPEARDLLARQIEATPRELEAALAQLSSLHDDDRLPIGEDAARAFLDARAVAEPLPIAAVARASAKFFAERLSDVRGPSRRRGVVLARSVGMYLARRSSGASLSEIGRYFGGRDHTTVLHACARVEALLAEDRALAEAATEILKLARRDPHKKNNTQTPTPE